ncbi:gastrula zinc finger protein XlCGF53.1 [Monomorium pharaonis]|uniref:gastrula zinc finger protein XlCGF53.1 n=1 Tax=Monomorium pharaonis TaxID=307658 RepID=UPI00102E11EB|nr:gastrula zinc finger protein XlCGF53.1 [Monomorium pharaonis]
MRKRNLQKLIKEESEFVKRISRWKSIQASHKNCPRKIVDRNAQVMYPVVSEYESIARKNEGSERTSLPQKYQISSTKHSDYVNFPMIGRPNFFMSRPLVRAAGLIKGNSTTEVIHVNTLSEGNTSIIQHSVVEIIDVSGRLHCLNASISPSCWLKIITLATDFQNYNVLLTISNGGLVLKTTKDIASGEPLLMWFDDSILTMLNIPFLTPVNCNIQGQVYICHNCNSCFDYPNPLKLHLALDCNRVDNSYIWMLLANKIINSPRTDLSFSQYAGRSFTFEPKPLSISRPIALPISIPEVQTNDATTRSLRNDSPCSSNQLSSTSSNGPSPIPPYSSAKSPPAEILPSSSTYKSSIENVAERNRHLALRSYEALIHQNVRNSFMPYNHPTVQAEFKMGNPAEVEALASDMGKCSAGYRCIFCQKIYSRKYGLRIHVRTHTGYKPLKCNYCQHRFGDPSNLNKHVRLHTTGDSPYKCNMCDKVLVRRRDLERHVNSWHSERNDANVSNVNDGD